MSSSPRKTRTSAPDDKRRGAKRPSRSPIDFVVRPWGVRGSIPSPGPDTARYGGNTPCVEVVCGGQRIVFDLGTGARSFGASLGGPLNAHVFISHYHYDHLQGLPFFGPMFDPRSILTVHGPSRGGQTVGDVISGQMQQPFFPVTAEMVFRARLDYQPFTAGDRVHVGGALVTGLEVHHPGGNLAYRVDYRGRSFVYATDTEHGTPRDAQLIEFARSADLLIYDAMYTEEEYSGRVGGSKVGWGHSTWESAIEVADAAKAKLLLLFHHDPTRTDDALDAMVKQVRKQRKATVAAKEGTTYKLG